MVEWRSISDAFKRAMFFVWGRFFRPVCRGAYWILILLLVLWAFTVVMLVGTHICLIFGKGPLGICKWWPDLILSLLFGSSAAQLTEAQYASLVSDMIAAFAFVVAVAAVVQAILYKRRVGRRLLQAQAQYDNKLKETKQDFERKMGITSQPIKQMEKDDLKWMLPHYKEADGITVFAGGFGWIATNSELKNRILELAHEKKLKLISFRNMEEVKKSFEEKNALSLFKGLKSCFKYESGLGDGKKVVCTMIQISPTARKFLYKSLPDEQGHAFNTCVLSDTDSTRELLHILYQLTRPEWWGKVEGE